MADTQTSPTCTCDTGRCSAADLEAAARYRKLANNNPTLRRDYLKRADECERSARWSGTANGTDDFANPTPEVTTK